MSPARRAVQLLAAAVFATALLAGCGAGGPARPSRVTVAYPSSLTSLHPALGSDEFAYSILSNVFEPLVELDGRQALRPGLALAWHNPDDLTWRFDLRPGARFHDGEPVTAAAAAAALEQLRTDSALRQTAALTAVDSFHSAGERTVEVRTRYPVPDLAARLTEFGIWRLPSAADAEPVGSGAYRVSRWQSGGDVELERLHGGGPEQLVFRALPEAADRLAALYRGEVDLIAEVPAAQLPAVRATAGLRVLESRGLRILFLGMNCRPGPRQDIVARGNPFHDPRVRRALSLALDRQALVAGPLGGLAEPLDQPLAPEVFGYIADLPPLGHDLAEARRLLAEAGHGEGFETALDYVPGKYRDVERVVEAVVADLALVGVRVRPRLSTYPQYLARLDRGDTPFYLRGWSTSVSAAQTYDYLLRSPADGFGSANAGGYSSPELDAVLGEAAREPDDAKRLVQLRRAAEIIRRDVPLVPLYRQFNLYAGNARLRFEPRLDRTIRGTELGWLD